MIVLRCDGLYQIMNDHCEQQFQCQEFRKLIQEDVTRFLNISAAIDVNTLKVSPIERRSFPLSIELSKHGKQLK